MSTRGNILFLNNYYLENEGIKKKDIKKINKWSDILNNGHQIYVHSDMYPSGALPMLQEYLQTDGAKNRAFDSSYLSAWFVVFKGLKMLPYTVGMTTDKNFTEITNPSMKNFKESKDYFGIGLMTGPAYDSDYSYVVAPLGEKYKTDKNSFDIYVFEGVYDNFVCRLNSEDNLNDFLDKKWWD